MADPETLLTGLGLGESARWHEGRLWLANWGTHEVLAVDVEGHCEVAARVPETFTFSIDWLPDGRLLVVSGQGGLLLRQEPDGTLAALLGRGHTAPTLPVSLLYAASDDPAVRETVLRALRAGAEASADYLAEHAGWSRRWLPREERQEACGGEMIQAQFVHRLARPVTDPQTGEATVDPQLHVHTLIASSVRRDDGSWAALYSEPLYAHAAAAGALGQAVMRDQLVRELGVQATTDPNGTFELEGITADQREEFSRRTAQVKATAKDVDSSTRRGDDVASLASREGKEEYRGVAGGVWRRLEDRLTSWGLTPEHIRERVLDRQRRGRQPRLSIAERTLVRDLGERQWIVRRRDVVRAVAAALPAGAGADQVEALADRILQSELLVPLRPDPRAVTADDWARWEERGLEQRWTTPAILRLEREMRDTALRRQEAGTATLTATEVEQAIGRWESRTGRTLTHGQRAMVERVCLGRGAVLIVEGRAGSGKTAAAEIIRDAYQHRGVHVAGAAVAGRAAVQLQEDAGIPSHTIFSTLRELEEHRMPKGSVLIIDEAGTVGARDVATLVRLSERQDFKLVLVGDRAQLQPIDGGAAFRALGDRLGTVELPEVLRQREDWQRQAAAALRADRGDEAWQVLSDHEAIRPIPGASDRQVQMVADYLELTAQGEDAVMLSQRRDETAELNEIAHEAARAAGRLGERSVVVNGRELSEGEHLVLLANNRGYDVRNGQRVVLRGIAGSLIEVEHVSNGRRQLIDTANYPDIDRGWALTVHKAQGLTADAALIAGAPSAYAELNYTAITRQRTTLRYYAVADEPKSEEDQAGVHHPDWAPEPPAWEDRYRRSWRRWEGKETTLDYEVGADTRPGQEQEPERFTRDPEQQRIEEERMRPPERRGPTR